MPVYPSPETWKHGTQRQRERAARSFIELRKRAVPVLDGALLVEDDDKVQIQPAADVARRILVLWAVVLRSGGVPRAETLELLDRLDLWACVSPQEKVFLQNENPNQEECKWFGWRMECIWTLLWALGHVKQMDWPSEMCDSQRVTELVAPNEDNPDFIASARLRPTSQILDAQDLILRIHWAIRDAWMWHGGLVPEDLDWSRQSDCIPTSVGAAVGIVEQRHHSLNWLANFMNPKDWDWVDTST
jgi:hypothetical protein